MDKPIDSLALEVKYKSADAASGIEALGKSLRGLKGAVGRTGLDKLAGEITKITNAIIPMPVSAGSKLSNIALGLEALSKVPKIANLGATTSNQIKAMGEAIRSISALDVTPIQTLASGLAPLATIGKSNLGATLNQLKKIPEVTAELAKMDMGAFGAQIQKVVASILPLSTEMGKVALGFSKLPVNIQKAINANAKLVTSNARTAKSYGVLGTGIRGAYLKFAIYAAVARRITSAIGSWVTTSNEYVENLNLYTIAMGKYTQEGLAYAEKVQSIMGIDPSQWIRYQAVFQNMITGFGVGSDKAAVMSKTLTQLGYDLASVFNVNFDTSMEKLESALSGQPRPMREWGFDLSEATLKAVALSLGIEKNVENMTQLEKVQLRYVQLLETAKRLNLTGDMARTIMTPANAMRILNQQVTMLTRALGNMFIPILMKVIPYVQAFVIALTEAAQAVANLLGFVLPTIDYSGLSGVAGSATDAEDGLSGAADAAKELKNATAGFDELNIISTQSAGSGVAGVSYGAGGLDIPLDTYNFFGDLEGKVNELVPKMKEFLSTVLLIGGALAAWKIASSVISFFSAGSSAGGVLAGTGVAGAAYTGLGVLAAIDQISRLYELAQNNKPFKDGMAAIGSAGAAAFDMIAGAMGVDVSSPNTQSNLGAAMQFLGLDVQDAIRGILSMISPLHAGLQAFTLGVRAIGLASNSAMDSVAIKAKFARDAIVKSANEQYTAVFESAQLMKESGAITEEEYQRMIDQAEKTKDETILAASEQYDKILIETAGGMDGINNLIDEKTGKIKTNWQLFCEDIALRWKNGWAEIGGFFSDTINGIIDGINTFLYEMNKLNPIVGLLSSLGLIANTQPTASTIGASSQNGGSSWGGSITPSWVGGSSTAGKTSTSFEDFMMRDLMGFAGGGYPTSGQLFMAREAGPELVGSIGNRTAVANNGQIVESLATANTGVVQVLERLLMVAEQIAEKDMGITDDQVGRANARYSSNRGVRLGTVYADKY